MTKPFIRLENVRKVYSQGKANEYLAVSDVTLEVDEGELMSIVGPSGCGKSTILMIIAGLTGNEGGTVSIGGESGSFDPHRDIGMVFQQSRGAHVSAWRGPRP